MFLKANFCLILLFSYAITVLSEEIWELVPIQKSNPNIEAYSTPSKVSDVNLDSVLFSCRNCFVFVSLFNDVDIWYSNNPIFISRLHPVAVKHLPGEIRHVPINLAKKVKKNSSLVFSPTDQPTICSSNFFDISSFEICTKINLTDFAAYNKPWNYQQYIYILPPNELVKMSTLWRRNYQYIEKKILQNIVGIVISNSEQIHVQWPLGRAYLNRWEVELKVSENIILFVLTLKSPERENQIYTILTPSTPISNNVSQWTNIRIPGKLQSWSLRKIEKLYNSQLAATSNNSLGTYFFPLVNEKDCNDKLLVSQFSNRYSIDELLMCLKTKVLWQYITGNKFKLEEVSEGNWPHIKFTNFAGYDIDSMYFVVAHPPTQTRFIACGDTFAETNSNYNILFTSFQSEIWITL